MPISRTNTVLFPSQTFAHEGDILAVPQLTEQSPFLNTNGLAFTKGINDEAMERIPQQIMSLLTLSHTPRFVVYSFGQTLHPAEHSIITSGNLRGIATNYQATAEMATRTVVRVENAPLPGSTNMTPHIVVENFNILAPD